LRDRHGSISERSAAMKQRKIATLKDARLVSSERLDMVKISGLRGGIRFDRLKYVKSAVVANFVPFNFLENQYMRHLFLSLEPDYPVQSLHHQNVRHHICELHSDTRSALIRDLAIIKTRSVSSLSLFIDVGRTNSAQRKFGPQSEVD